MAKDTGSTFRLSIQFNIQDEDQKKCVEFLTKCGHKKRQILALMTKEFLNSYGFDVDSATEEDIKNFLSSYQYIQNFKNKNITGINVAGLTVPIPIEKIEESSSKSTEKPKKMKLPEMPAEKKSAPKVPLPSIDENDEPYEVDEANADKALSAFGL